MIILAITVHRCLWGTMQVIMRRAKRKLQLSHNVIGDEILDCEGSNGVTEAGDLKSVIFGLHVFDPEEITTEKSDNLLDTKELAELAEKVILSRQELQSDVGDRKFEINSMDHTDDQDLVKLEGSEPINLDPGLDEATYLSWVEKFRQPSAEQASDAVELGNKRCLPDERQLKAETARKKAEEKKLSKWEALGYHSLSVSDPVSPDNQDVTSDAGSVHFVYGDCTTTSAVPPSESTIIFRYISGDQTSFICSNLFFHYSMIKSLYVVANFYIANVVFLSVLFSIYRSQKYLGTSLLNIIQYTGNLCFCFFSPRRIHKGQKVSCIARH